MLNKYFLYRHIRLDKNEPFYIGIGTKNNKGISEETIYKRAYEKVNRNKTWYAVLEKTEYRVEVFPEEYNNYEVLKEKEREFIKLYGRINLGTGTLTNCTSGGQGVVGMIHSDETKAQMSKVKKGQKRSPETIEKTRQGNIGRKNSPESIEKTRQGNIGLKRTPETIEKLRQAKIGKKQSPEHIEKRASARRGKKHSQEAIQNMSMAQQNRTQETREKMRVAKSKLVMDINTGKIYPSVKQAALENNISATHLGNMLKGIRTNKTTLKYI